jgi:CheY-like chemotaxis protein
VPALSAVPIIAVTSFALPAERDRALAIGCNGYIEKPIAPLTFAEQVRSFLSS